MHIKPASGRQVVDPERGGFLPKEGRTVEKTQYWMRRVNDGDVVIVEPQRKQKSGAKSCQ